MSYDMTIHYKDGRKARSSVGGMFGKYWLKPQKVLSLQFIPEISSSGNFKRRRDIELLLMEIETLKQYHLDRGMTPLVLEATRIDPMIEQLKAIHAEWEMIERVSF